MLKSRNTESGQILLVVVLAAVISLTVGLSAISRTVTNTRVSTEEANSQKALAAAEAGIEEQLSKSNITVGISDPKPLSDGSTFSTTSQELGGSQFPLNNGASVDQDDGADIWLSDYPSYNNPLGTLGSPLRLSILWNAPANGGSGCETTDPAIEIAIISGTRNDPSMNRYVVDGCGSRRNSNNFAVPSSLVSPPGGFNMQYDIPFDIVNGYIARVIPLYTSSPIYVRSNAALPAQGYIINSTGKSGDTVRQVKVIQNFPTLPIEFFPYNIFLP